MDDVALMRRCIQLARLGQGSVAPNPMVGAVVVHNSNIIGEGWHRQFGMAHAEVNAINDVNDRSLFKEATIYVNLEPCSHYGKTPPCTEYIIKNEIPRVVIGMTDPFSEVNGNGVRRLMEAGIEVVNGVCENECKKLNKRFITFHQKKRPYVILKWAESADGFMGIHNQNVRLSNQLTAILTHKWRSREQVVMVGSKTVSSDNPQLNVRFWFGKNPLRVIMEGSNKISPGAMVLDGTIPTIVFTKGDNAIKQNLEYIHIDNGSSLMQVMRILHERNIQSVLVEGGSTLLNSFIEQDFWDEARVFYSPVMLNHGIKAPSLNFISYNEASIGNNRLVIYKNKL